MTFPGPDYPHPPAAGSNALGSFVIGVSPLGDIPAYNLWDAVPSQYANSPAITYVLQAFFDAVDQTSNIDWLHDTVWNIQTAQGYGLDLLGRIVGVSRVIQVPTTKGSMTFAEVGATGITWNTGVSYIAGQWVVTNVNQGGGSFYAGSALTTNYSLSDDAFRSLILAKAAANISDCSIPSINKVLLTLFPHRGNAYVQDKITAPAYFGFAETGNALPFNQGVFYNGQTLPTLVMTYVFNFPLSDVELAIVSTSGVLPKPTGVQASILIL